MSTAGLELVLRAMRAADGPDAALTIGEIAERSGQPGHEIRAALRHMLELEPNWVDADVVPGRGMAWWLTGTGRRAAE